MRESLNINAAITAYNYKRDKEKEPKITQESLGLIVFPELDAKQAGWKISRINSGDKQQSKLYPSEIRKICEVLKCEPNFLFQ